MPSPESQKSDEPTQSPTVAATPSTGSSESNTCPSCENYLQEREELRKKVADLTESHENLVEINSNLRKELERLRKQVKDLRDAGPSRRPMDNSTNSTNSAGSGNDSGSANSSPDQAQAQQKKKPRARKPKPDHPSVAEMVMSAITTLGNRKGSSLVAIKKFMTEHFNVDAAKIAAHIRKYILKALGDGELIQTSGKGANGSFKLPPLRRTPARGASDVPAGPSAPRKRAPAKKRSSSEEAEEEQSPPKKAKTAKKKAPAARKGR